MTSRRKRREREKDKKGEIDTKGKRNLQDEREEKETGRRTTECIEKRMRGK